MLGWGFLLFFSWYPNPPEVHQGGGGGLKTSKGEFKNSRNLIAKRQKNSILFYPPRWFSESVSLSFYTDFLFSTFDCHFSIVPSSFFLSGWWKFFFFIHQIGYYYFFKNPVHVCHAVAVIDQEP